ncbi:4Fe-4S binding protein [Campylobacter mucosalis]|uniref:Putative iron-sulfur dicluster domain protein n=1 Tax=Campylobacter mucosalis CCUG 21559 TaxID=1032067 RepID=A0A6G5QEW6_9BACT|nr:4Fe-4S dicluster domain-containing protein [Campylobacter mucosalis]QCD44235.1 putative iron-sulfur dicluster domain protein [Campylobacter mucosalis CCUG 21559]
MKEFGFYDNVGGVMLNEQIEVSSDENIQFLVANSKKLKAEIYAPEISFYLRNSKDSVLDKSKNTLLLYEARASVFDGAKDIDYEKKVGKNVVIVSNAGRDSLSEILKQQEYKVITLNHFEIKFIYGAVGELTIIVLNEQGEFELEADFVLIENARDYMLRQSGCVEISSKSDDEVLAFLNSHSPNYAYKSFITYDQSICQYHERRQEVCAKCAEVCPSVSILKDDEKKHLVFSHIDCINCGECISVCPSGALDSSLMPRDTFFNSARLYKGKIPLILLTDELENLNVELPLNVLPFGVRSEKFLNETHLLSLLQESGANLIIYPATRSRGTMAAIDMINQIYELKFKKPAIFVAKNEAELKDALLKASLIDGSQKSISSYALPKREIFANRLSFLVGDDDLGVVFADGIVEYGKVEINRDTCTLCLSCVGACNVNALIADKSDNSIKFNPSVCTACGYCELSCAEKDTISLKRGKIELKPQTFTYYELARDELFKCVECGKEFATKKAVEKIATIMTPRFARQPDKIRTLYCCSDCKAKVMIKAQLAAQNMGESYE